MTEAHTPALAEIGVGQPFWDFMVYGHMQTADDMRGWVLDILSRAEKGTDLPFVAIHLEFWPCGRRDALFEYHAQ